MDNNEAKFILKAYRPGGADAGDAQFSAALTQAERDPELRVWFEREQACDKAMAVKLKAIPVPAGLRESILAGGKVTAARRAWWRQPFWLAMAASVALLIAVVSIWRYQTVSTDWSQVVAQLSADAAHAEKHGSAGETAKQFTALVANASTHLSSPLPVNLGRLKADGCRTLTVAGHEVMEICFERNGGEFHLYVMKRPPSRDVPSGPQFAARGAMHSVLWTDANHLYVMASAKDEAALKALL
ncbi:MAG: DUF3379 family protein [Nibricoccus sp.]